MTWIVDRNLLVGDVTRKINQASLQVQGDGDPLLEHIETLQRFKRALLRAQTEPQYVELAEEWHATDQRGFEEI